MPHTDRVDTIGKSVRESNIATRTPLGTTKKARPWTMLVLTNALIQCDRMGALLLLTCIGNRRVMVNNGSFSSNPSEHFTVMTEHDPGH